MASWLSSCDSAYSAFVLCPLVYLGVVKLFFWCILALLSCPRLNCPLFFGVAKLTFVIWRGYVVSWWLALLSKSLVLFTCVKPCWVELVFVWGTVS